MVTHIYYQRSKKTGPTIALIGGIHGDEQVGVKILDSYRNYIPLCGTLILIYGNPRAIQKKIRYTEKDLNRCFLNKTGRTYEHNRAREIRAVLRTCDAVLDIHSYDPKWDITFPFIICENTSISTSKELGIPLITTNWKQFHKGSTDHLMDSMKKVGICLESGPKNLLQSSTNVARKTIKLFLAKYGMHKKIINKNRTRVQNLKKIPFKKDGTCSLRK